MINKKTQGKKNKEAGARFELKVRKDLESTGWIVSKWQNNVELHDKNSIEVSGVPKGYIVGEDFEKGFIYGKLVPAKMGRYRTNQSGFPDFICFRFVCSKMPKGFKIANDYDKYMVEGVEAKSNGYLDKTEKEKCLWLLSNHIFSRILIASKGTKRGEIIYKEFKC